MAYSIYDVVQWFQREEKPNIDAMKIQKVIFYAQSWSLALEKKKLIDSPFEAWVDGPVNRGLWEIIKYQGGVEKKEHQIQPETFALLESIEETYGQESGGVLSSLSHKETPWVEARKGISPNQRSDVKLDESLMVEYIISKSSLENKLHQKFYFVFREKNSKNYSIPTKTIEELRVTPTDIADFKHKIEHRPKSHVHAS